MCLTTSLANRCPREIAWLHTPTRFHTELTIQFYLNCIYPFAQRTLPADNKQSFYLNSTLCPHHLNKIKYTEQFEIIRYSLADDQGCECAWTPAVNGSEGRNPSNLTLTLTPVACDSVHVGQRLKQTYANVNTSKRIHLIMSSRNWFWKILRVN